MEPAYTYQATITHEVDGDTVDVAVDLGFHVMANVRLRLYGVDTPERGEAGFEQASAATKALVPVGSTVVVRTYRAEEKYGRFLALVQLPDGRVLNDLLVQQGLAKTYFGGTKS